MKKMNETKVLALREGTYASYDELERYIAENWNYSIDADRKIAVISVRDVQGPSFWCANTYSRLRATIELALNSQDVEKIVLEINSPGGDVNGLFEACEYITKAKEIKPIHAHVTGMCCSAAYAIAGSCTDISATETSEIGSVGVYAQAFDYSGWEKKNGILSRIFRSKNADKKNQSAFTEEGAKDIQEKIDFYEDCFYTVLSEGRGIEREKCIEDFGNGAVFLSADALERNMIDLIAAYGELINRLASSDEEEDEGEDDMDIKAMTAEQKAELFKALVADTPSLLAEAEETARVNERTRVTGLYALRTDDNKDIVDKAVEEGKTADSIMGALYHAEKERADKLAAANANLDMIRKQAEGGQDPGDLQNPMPDEMGAKVKSVIDKVTAARKEEGKK